MSFNVTIKQLLEAGIHFGHQTKRWNPKMRPYIYGVRNGIHIVDLQKSLTYFQEAYNKVLEIVQDGGIILFIGTKKQANPIVMEEAKRCNMPYCNERWLGGMLTNFATIRLSVQRLKELEELKESEEFFKFTKKEMSRMDKEILKLQKVLNGIRDMGKIPDAVFIVDIHHEIIAAKEAKRLDIPIIGVADTNADPALADYLIPGNDDAIRSIKLVLSTMADAVIEGRKIYEARFNKGKVTENMEEGISEEILAESNSEEAGIDVNSKSEDADIDVSM
ncbi:MAG: 30S ribosomal protein S2 [Deltaproteobacteria bacterium]|nr:30S ribosomal protein S2 [Deltaproteobacteria bacterium]